MRSYVILSIFPTRFFREVYTTYLLPSKFYGYTSYRVNRGNNHYVGSFSPYFPTRVEGVLPTYPTLLLIFFPQGFLEETIPRMFNRKYKE